jgi:hypothetical protein
VCDVEPLFVAVAPVEEVEPVWVEVEPLWLEVAAPVVVPAAATLALVDEPFEEPPQAASPRAATSRTTTVALTGLILLLMI